MVDYAPQTETATTLHDRLAGGALSLPESLRFATMLAEALRQLHESGRVCGSLQPSGIVVTAAGLELSVASGEQRIVNPYTAPEILQGQPADSRSDIFAFGAILYQMVAGRRAFAGDTPDALAVSLAISIPTPSGNPAIDHLIGNCIAKDPALRCQRMQKVILELKLLSISPKPEVITRQQTVTAVVRAQAAQLESRVTELLQSQGKVISAVQQSSGDSINELRARIETLEAELRPVQARTDIVEALCASVMKHLEQVQENVASIDQRIAGLREQNEILSQGVTVMQEYMGSRMHEFEQTLKSQRTTLASIAASQEQTDDVVEGVVGAMELVHTLVFDREEAFG